MPPRRSPPARVMNRDSPATVTLPRTERGPGWGELPPVGCNRTVANDQKKEGGPPRSPMAMLNVGFEMAVPLLVLVFAGYKADGWLETDPWLKVVGALLGIVVGLYNFYKRLLPTGGRPS